MVLDTHHDDGSTVSPRPRIFTKTVGEKTLKDLGEVTKGFPTTRRMLLTSLLMPLYFLPSRVGEKTLKDLGEVTKGFPTTRRMLLTSLLMPLYFLPSRWAYIFPQDWLNNKLKIKNILEGKKNYSILGLLSKVGNFMYFG
ncbi:hypothetical protein L6452_22113 [Arctium lappa]|uniref:Uncharacterized protein n=1 Tax=Arctium lappa TaxID=4217 RepID=A0ACB9B0K7_ARCLA|nr:hypothetical protein L6452_22113 [Arctium lappa]